MGLFDIFKKREAAPQAKSQKELARLTRVVSSKLSQDYDRQEAIAELSAMANAAGAKALLRRFDFTMEPSITDRDEKESAAAGIVGAGTQALEPIRAYCSTAESITWPIKVLREIVEPEQLVDELLELLEQFDTEYVRNAEPKVQLINLLEEFPGEEVRIATEPFLMDANENVRFHATGTVFAMNDPRSVQPLLEALQAEESLRVRNRIAGGLAEKKWEVGELPDKLAKGLPGGFVVQNGRLVRR